MRQPSRGFTLIELVATIALVGTASATALPAMVALHQQAEASALASLAGAAGAAMLLNQAGCLITDGQAVPGKCKPLHDCHQVSALLMDPLPEGYQVAPAALSPQGGHCSVVRVRDGESAYFHAAATGR